MSAWGRPCCRRGARTWALTSRYDPPNVAGNFRTIPSERLRCRVDDLEGYAVDEIDHPVQAQVSVVLDPPVAGNITMLSAGALSGAGTHEGHIVAPTQDAGTSWAFIAADNNGDGTTGNLTYAGVTIIYTGGGAPFPTSYRYESAVKASAPSSAWAR